MNIPRPNNNWINRDGTNEAKDPDIVYGVEWIEIEWGSRSEGYSLFIDLDRCIKDTKAASERGPYGSGGGYCGPVIPLHYVIIPFNFLEDEYKDKLRDSGKAHTKNHWSPMFKGNTVYIK